MLPAAEPLKARIDLLAKARGKQLGAILANLPCKFENRTGKVAPGHKWLNRYGTMTLDDIRALPVAADALRFYLSVANTRCLRACA